MLNSNPALSRFVLEQLGLPFRKPEEPRQRTIAKDNRPKEEKKEEPAAAAPAAPAGAKKS